MATERHRSPNYPSFGLSVALDALKMFYGEAKRTTVDGETAARAIGYGGLNGKSRMVLSALKKYGLCDEADGKYRVSDLGMRFLVAPAENEAIAALRQAAMTPEIFNEIHKTHRDASSNVLVSYLVMEKGFSEDGARLFDKAYRDTIKLAKLETEPYIPTGTTNVPEEKPHVQQPTTSTQRSPQQAPPTPPAGAFQRSFTTGTDSMDATITITSHAGAISREDIEFLKQYLDFLEKSWSRRKPTITSGDPFKFGPRDAGEEEGEPPTEA